MEDRVMVKHVNSSNYVDGIDACVLAHMSSNNYDAVVSADEGPELKEKGERSARRSKTRMQVDEEESVPKEQEKTHGKSDPEEEKRGLDRNVYTLQGQEESPDRERTCKLLEEEEEEEGHENLHRKGRGVLPGYSEAGLDLRERACKQLLGIREEEQNHHKMKAFCSTLPGHGGKLKEGWCGILWQEEAAAAEEEDDKCHERPYGIVGHEENEEEILQERAPDEILGLQEVEGEAEDEEEEKLQRLARIEAMLEAERLASSTAAIEAMAMIARLQAERARALMEARRCRSDAEEREAHAREALSLLRDALALSYKEQEEADRSTIRGSSTRSAPDLQHDDDDDEEEEEEDGAVDCHGNGDDSMQNGVKMKEIEQQCTSSTPALLYPTIFDRVEQLEERFARCCSTWQQQQQQQQQHWDQADSLTSIIHHPGSSTGLYYHQHCSTSECTTLKLSPSSSSSSLRSSMIDSSISHNDIADQALYLLKDRSSIGGMLDDQYPLNNITGSLQALDFHDESGYCTASPLPRSNANSNESDIAMSNIKNVQKNHDGILELPRTQYLSPVPCLYDPCGGHCATVCNQYATEGRSLCTCTHRPDIGNLRHFCHDREEEYNSEGIHDVYEVQNPTLDSIGVGQEDHCIMGGNKEKSDVAPCSVGKPFKEEGSLIVEPNMNDQPLVVDNCNRLSTANGMEYFSRKSCNLVDATRLDDQDSCQLKERLRALEEERISMQQAMDSLRRENRHLIQILLQEGSSPQQSSSQEDSGIYIRGSDARRSYQTGTAPAPQQQWRPFLLSIFENLFTMLSGAKRTGCANGNEMSLGDASAKREQGGLLYLLNTPLEALGSVCITKGHVVNLANTCAKLRNAQS